MKRYGERGGGGGGEVSLLLGSSQGVWYNGCNLDVTLALSKAELEKKKTAIMPEKDKRNLYLLKEGSKEDCIMPCSLSLIFSYFST